MNGVKRSLLQHSGRGAALDRYNTIRNFFRQQPPLTRPYTSSTLLLRLELSSRSFKSTLPSRHFSVRAPLLQEDLGRRSLEKNSEQDHAKSTATTDGDSVSHKSTAENPRLEQYPRFFRQLAMSLPHLQRPTRDDFLKAADGFWQRARIRFRWLTIRSFRRYNADEMSAFFTWFLMSQTLWLFVGT